MNYYKDIKFVPIFNFFEALENNDCRYLLKLDDYSELPNIENNEMNEIYHDMVNEYNSKSNNRLNDIIFNKRQSITKLTVKKNKINFMLSILSNRYNKNITIDIEYFKKELEKEGFKINDSDDESYYNSLHEIQRQTKGIDYNIARKEKEIESNAESNENISYIDMIAIIESKTGVKFDIHNDTMRYFLSCKKELESKIRKKVA